MPQHLVTLAHLAAAGLVFASVMVAALLALAVPQGFAFAGVATTALLVTSAFIPKLRTGPAALPLALLHYVGVALSALALESLYPAAGVSLGAVLTANVALVFFVGPATPLADEEASTRNMQAFRLRPHTKIHIAMATVALAVVATLAYGFETRSSAPGLICGGTLGLIGAFWVSAGVGTLGLTQRATSANALPSAIAAVLTQPARAALSAITGPYVLTNTPALRAPDAERVKT